PRPALLSEDRQHDSRARVDGIAHHATRVDEPRRAVGEFDEIGVALTHVERGDAQHAAARATELYAAFQHRERDRQAGDARRAPGFPPRGGPGATPLALDAAARDERR